MKKFLINIIWKKSLTVKLKNQEKCLSLRTGIGIVLNFWIHEKQINFT